MKIRFDIKYRPQIESGQYKVEDASGIPMRIICWDADGDYPIVALTEHNCEFYDNHGNHFYGGEKQTLMVVTREIPHLTKFEKAVMDVIGSSMGADFEYPVGEDVYNDDCYADIRNVAKELLEVAKEELSKPTEADCMNAMRHYLNSAVGPEDIEAIDRFKVEIKNDIAKNRMPYMTEPQFYQEVVNRYLAWKRVRNKPADYSKNK